MRNSTHIIRCGYAVRRGNALIFTIITLPAILGITSLAVDYGRIRLAKAELQDAADAAVRYGVTGIATSPATARSRAKAAAAENVVGGSALTLSDSDIQLGSWDSPSRTFTVLSGAAESSANAIRVTAARNSAKGNALSLFFAAAIGKSTCDVQTTSVALITTTAGSGGYGITALSDFDMQNQAATDSYDSSAGPYSAGSAGSSSVVQTNGDIGLKNTARINGDAHPGIGKTLTTQNSSLVTGNTANLTTTLTYPPVDVTSAAASNNNGSVSASYLNGSRDFEMKNNDTYTLPAGTYYFNKFQLKNHAALTLSGPVIIYATGNVDLQNHSYVNTYGNRPSNLKFNVAGGSSVELKNHAVLVADIYNPEGNFDIQNHAEFSGAVVANDIEMKNDSKIHQDLSLTGGASGGAASTSVAVVQ